MIRGRVAQPPIEPESRPSERQDFWPGFVLALIGALVILSGARHMTNVDTTEGGTAWEIQLVKAFASGGLEIVDTAPPPDPAAFEDPVQAAAALEQWERANARPIRTKFRVNTGAANPCPT